MAGPASVKMALKKCNTCKQEIDESNFVGNQCKECHAAYLESLGGEDQYSS
ncbi:MAG TPA: hypothetical protein VHK86_06475 [Nitrososphaera sp.]|jgi:hypothetical protein|nr:hypothetical protein [Nitrososphaera sp.]